VKTPWITQAVWAAECVLCQSFWFEYDAPGDADDWYAALAVLLAERSPA
jgi:hypothetical protein